MIARGFLAICLALIPVAASAFCADPAPVVTIAAPDRGLWLDTPHGRLAATLTAPEATPRAAVLLLHGFTGTRDELRTAGGDGMFARAARLMAERGVASLRIDFRGSGESGGTWADTTVEGQALDATAALAAFAGMPAAGGHAPAVLGFSMGGLAAVSVGQVASRVVLWNPVMEPRRTFAAILGEAVFANAADGGTAVVGTTGLRPAFFAGIAAARPQESAARLDAPLLIVSGAGDSVVKDGPAIAQTLAGRRAGATQIITGPMGHDLGALRDLAAFDALVACTAGFLLAP